MIEEDVLEVVVENFVAILRHFAIAYANARRAHAQSVGAYQVRPIPPTLYGRSFPEIYQFSFKMPSRRPLLSISRSFANVLLIPSDESRRIMDTHYVFADSSEPSQSQGCLVRLTLDGIVFEARPRLSSDDKWIASMRLHDRSTSGLRHHSFVRPFSRLTEENPNGFRLHNIMCHRSLPGDAGWQAEWLLRSHTVSDAEQIELLLYTPIEIYDDDGDEDSNAAEDRQAGDPLAPPSRHVAQSRHRG